MPKAAIAASLTLCAFRAAAFDAAGGSLPSRLVICPPGTSDARSRGKVIVNADTFSGLEERQNAAKLGMRLALDAEHCTVPGTSAYLAEKEPRTVLAWATLSGDVTTGLVFEDIDWTPLGIEAHKNKQFQDISPAVFRRADGTVIAVHSAALCRQGEIDGLTLEAATAGAQLSPFFAALSAPLPNTTRPTSDPMKELLLAILKALNMDLAADADEATIESAAKDAPSKISALLQAPPAAMTADMQTLQTQLTTLSGKVETLTNERDTFARNELIRQAQAEGKVIPLSAEVLAITPLNVLTEIVKQAKAGEVPLGKTTVTAETKDKPEAFNAETEAVFSKMGLTKADYEKYGKAA